MLDQTQLGTLLQTLNRDQKIWLSGYLQGQAGGETQGAALAAVEKPKVNLYYATETGNAKGLSLSVMKALKAAGYKVKNAAVNRLKPADIPADQIAIFLVSTHGEGDPPESAVKFFEALKAEKDGALKGLPFAVLGLGDKSYEIFCGAATQLSEHIKRLGGAAFQEDALFDVDYVAHTPAWIDQIVKTLDATYGAAAHTSAVVSPSAEPAALKTGRGYSRLEPIKATVQSTVILNDTDSRKKTYHMELSYDDADVTYTAGDAIGIMLPPIEGEDEPPAPRLYSISSAPSVHEGEVHMTVALATYTHEDGTVGYGRASKFLADCKEGDVLDVYISQNQIFNLPSDDQDMIMVGPGTGVAPFRSFVYERSDRAANGRNWLFFGDQHAHCDFLYQAEWQEHLATEALHRLDLAFSRDQEERIYVQDKMKARAKELVEWLDGGAAFYVCGAKDPMSRDVEATLIEILTAEKGLTAEQAEDYIADMEEAGRYLKDVY